MPKKILGTLTDHLIDTLDEACIGVDREGRIQFANPAACEVLSLGEDCKGTKLWDATPVREFTRVFSPLIKSSGATSREQIIVLPGERAYVVQMSPVRGSEGRLAGAVAVLRDVSSIRRIESDVTALVQRISQELKVPLTSIKGYVETLLEGALSEPAVCKRFLQIINDETNRMARLLVGLLDAAGQEPVPAAPPPLVEVSLARVLRRVVDNLAPFARQKELEMTLRLSEPLAAARAHEEYLEQAVTNLLDNAIKFTGLDPQARGRVVVAARDDGARVQIEIQDNGVGMDPAEHEKVFERFYRVRSGPGAELGGTGLGLAIARDLVRAMGGQIEVRSALGEGSTFVISLPAVPSLRASRS